MARPRDRRASAVAAGGELAPRCRGRRDHEARRAAEHGRCRAWARAGSGACRARRRVVNGPEALLATHDKLLTAERLARAGLPSPWTQHRAAADPRRAVPVRRQAAAGSWGQDVLLCRAPEDLTRTLALISGRPWWRRHGALIQELVGPTGRDFRVVVAGRHVVAGGERIAAPDEWRTNVTLGGLVVRAEVPAKARALAVAAIARRSGWTSRASTCSRRTAAGSSWSSTARWTSTRSTRCRASTPTGRSWRSGPRRPGVQARAERGTLEATTEKEATMAKSVQGKPARAGDQISITGHSVGDSPKTAVILEVLEDPGPRAVPRPLGGRPRVDLLPGRGRRRASSGRAACEVPGSLTALRLREIRQAASGGAGT